jgi:hypothetical protein
MEYLHTLVSSVSVYESQRLNNQQAKYACCYGLLTSLASAFLARVKEPTSKVEVFLQNHSLSSQLQGAAKMNTCKGVLQHYDMGSKLYWRRGIHTVKLATDQAGLEPETLA